MKMKWTQKGLERARIACGLNPYDVNADPLPRAAAMKAWHAKWDRPLTYGGGYMKALGGQVQIGGSAAKSYSAPALNAFHDVVTDHSLNNATVELWSSGRELTAGGLPVLAIKSAGVSRYGFDLVELTTDRARYVVERAALKRN